MHKNDSFIGRLIEEVSCEGAQVKRYRQGGRGLENVLTAEVWQALHYLPRDAFLGQILRSASGYDARTLNIDVDATRIDLQTDELTLLGGAGVHPDVQISTQEALVRQKGQPESA